MAFDAHLADRVRALLGEVDGVAEIRMFGGMCLTVGGNMAVGVLGDDLIVRVGRAGFDAALGKPGARPFDFTGRPSTGIVFVDAATLTRTPGLLSWVNRGVTYAQSLPPKHEKLRRRATPGAGGRGRRTGL